MVSNKKLCPPIQTLPTELVTEIMWRVGSYSREDLRDCMLTCKAFSKAVHDPKEGIHDPQVFKTMSLHDVVINPQFANSLFKNVFNRCLQHSNPSALYVKGILEYFVHANPLDGLSYLKQAADASVQEAVYLYEIITIARGDFNQGSLYMEQLNWRVNMDHANTCWINIKKSLEYIEIRPTSIYFTSLLDMKLESTCNIFDLDNPCPRCYYYKNLVKFIFRF